VCARSSSRCLTRRIFPLFYFNFYFFCWQRERDRGEELERKLGKLQQQSGRVGGGGGSKEERDERDRMLTGIVCMSVFVRVVCL
jgi:hypothetical protein